MGLNIEAYKDLFVHRSDVYAVQTPKGHYAPAGKGHWDKDEERFVYDEYYPLTDDCIEEHLAGVASYGVYVVQPFDVFYDEVIGAEMPRGPANSVKYLVFDLDTYTEEAYEWLVHCLEAFLDTAHDAERDIRKCLLMENSGGKGFHAWLFLSAPTPAAQVRAWVAQDFMPMWEEQARFFDGTPLEVFPKQDIVETGAFGNLVKLPFGIHAKSGNRSEVVGVQGWASSVDSVQRLNTDLIPVVVTEAREAVSGGSAKGATAPFPCVAKLIEQGAGQGVRDKAMYHFARFALTQGLPQDLVQEWAERVNEGFQPPLTTTEVRTKVRSACGAASDKHSCNAEWLQDFCPGGEACKAPWNEERQQRKASVRVAYMGPAERQAQREREQ